MTEKTLPALTEAIRTDLADKARAIIARYPEGRSRSALLPMLHLVQSVEGYVSPEGMAFCAEMLGLKKAEVAAVATFYTMYKRRPTGDYLVSVCTNTMCGILGGQQAFDTLREHLGVGHDQTSADGKITLEHAECLAACDYAPVLTVNYEFFDQIDAAKALEIVKELQAGERPRPDRGARLCTFKETSFQLAGFIDDREGAITDGPAGEPTLAGLRLAAEQGVSVEFDPNTPLPAVAPKDAKPGAPAPAKEAPKQEPPKDDASKVDASKETPKAGAPASGTVPSDAAKESRDNESSKSAPGAPTPLPGNATAEGTSTSEPNPTTPQPAADGKPAGDAPGPDRRADPAGESQKLADDPAVNVAPKKAPRRRTSTASAASEPRKPKQATAKKAQSAAEQAPSTDDGGDAE